MVFNETFSNDNWSQNDDESWKDGSTDREGNGTPGSSPRQHLLNASAFRRENRLASYSVTRREKTNAGAEVHINLRPEENGSRADTDVDLPTLIQRELHYYKNSIPPFVLNKGKQNRIGVVAQLLDHYGKRTNKEIAIQARDWKSQKGPRGWTHEYLTAIINGKTHILCSRPGGSGGCNYHLWLGHENGISDIVTARPKIGGAFGRTATDKNNHTEQASANDERSISSMPDTDRHPSASRFASDSNDRDLQNQGRSALHSRRSRRAQNHGSRTNLSTSSASNDPSSSTPQNSSGPITFSTRTLIHKNDGPAGLQPPTLSTEADDAKVGLPDSNVSCES